MSKRTCSSAKQPSSPEIDYVDLCDSPPPCPPLNINLNLGAPIAKKSRVTITLDSDGEECSEHEDDGDDVVVVDDADPSTRTVTSAPASATATTTTTSTTTASTTTTKPAPAPRQTSFSFMDSLLSSGTPSDLATYHLLKSESEIRNDLLSKHTYKCNICLDDTLTLDEMISLSCTPTSHRICIDCFKGYCSSKITEGVVSDDELICPEINCKTAISVHEIKEHLPSDIMEKYDRFKLREFATKSAERTGALCVTCPKCNDWFCEVGYLAEAEVVLWRSLKCGDKDCNHDFCGSCGQAPHRAKKAGSPGDITCKEYASRLEESGGDESEMLLKKFMSEQKDAQFCPECKVPSTLEPGCCKFTVCRCRTRFCFVCGIKLCDADHYRHYTGAGMKGPFGDVCKGVSDPDAGKAAAVMTAQEKQMADMGDKLADYAARGQKRFGFGR
jgi:hypothetical protein